MFTSRKSRQVSAPRRLRRAAALAKAGAVLFCGVLALHAEARAQQPSVTIPNVPVLDQFGRQRLFYTDLVQGKKVVISVMYTTCTTACPTFADVIARQRRRLRNRPGGRDVHFISITIHPQHDNPERLRSWASRSGYESGGGGDWTCVTGSPAQVERLLRNLRFPTRRVMHGPMVLLGDAARDKWERVYAFSPELSTRIDRLIGRR
jgi:cytochrome oxidase Cu insertion factor (SCO1/SenC/PrrC family)